MNTESERLGRNLGMLAFGVAAAVLGVTILDLIAGMKLRQSAKGAVSRRGIRVRRAITVDTSPEAAYSFWRNFENLPRFMTDLESVRVMDQSRSYWKVKAPLGTTAEWAAEITDDLPNRLIAWRSLEGADVPNLGEVRFTPLPGGRGVEVHVDLTYDPPGGIVGATIAMLFGEEPSRQVEGDLRRFKRVMEMEGAVGG